MLDAFNRASQEALAKPLEFLHAIGGEKFEASLCGAFIFAVVYLRQKRPQAAGNGFRRRFGRIHDGDVRRGHTMQKRLEQRGVRATEDKGVRVLEFPLERFTKADASR